MEASLNSDTYYEFSYHEFTCTTCSDDAVAFCVKCTQYLCKWCLRFHNCFPDFINHKLLYKDEFWQVPTLTSKDGIRDMPSGKCQKHHGKLIDMFCEDHDMIGCSACAALKHRQCKHLHYIPDIACSRLSQRTIQAVSKNLCGRLDEFETLKQCRLDTKTRIANEKDTCLKAIKERRERINEYLDEVENTLYHSVSQKYEEISTKLDNDLKKCDNSISLLETMKGKLKPPGVSQISQTFIDLKHAEHIVKETDTKLRNCKRNRNDRYTIIYEEGSSISGMWSPDTLFGNIESGFMKEEAINVRFNSDKSVCDCKGLCQLPDGTFVITDSNNNNIKSIRYGNIYKKSHLLSVTNSPFGVCTVNDKDVAVTIPREKNVSIVSVRSKMTVKSSFNTDSCCYGIAYAEGFLYVGHLWDPKLTVYYLKGQYLKTFSHTSNGESLFESPLHLCINHEKPQIIVADGHKGIVVIDKTGNLATEYMYSNKGWTRGVCMDDTGKVYIADYRSKQILVLDMDGTVTTLLDDLSDNPRAVLFDRQRRRFWVTYEDRDDIKSFSLQ